MLQRTNNPDLIRSLFESYFLEEADSQDTEFTSSHWKYFGDQYNVQADSEGNLTALEGIGFGHVKWSGLKSRLIDQLLTLSMIAETPNRLEIIRLRSVASKICQRIGLDATTDLLRQLFGLNLVKKNLSATGIDGSKLRVLMIGDGYGILSAVVKTLYPESTVVMVDIGKTLLFQAYYCQLAHPDRTHLLVNSLDNDKAADFVYCPTEKLSLLSQMKFDVAINIASMGEMNNETVDRYFEFLRSCVEPKNLFYCLNRERKELIGGEISEFETYPWRDGDKHLIDEYCSWYRYYFGRGRNGEGRKLFGLRIPMICSFDGPLRHRLSILETD